MRQFEARAVFLDLDDTYVYTIEPIWALHRHIAQTHYGIELADADLAQHWGKPLHELVKALYQTQDAEPALERIKAVKLNPEFRKRFVDPSHDAFGKLKAKHKVGMVTAHLRNILAIEFKYLNLSPADFDYLQTADDTSYHKPDPRVFEPAIAWLKEQSIDPDQAVYVGDGLHDMTAARGAGLQFIGVETGLVSHETFRQVGAVSVASIAEVPALLN